MQNSRFIYIHDPMCSWCWGHRPQWDQFEYALSELVSVEYCVGGLAPDCDDPMPLEQRETIMAYWRKIQSLLGAEFNFDFWINNVPRRSTYPACRAVIAARWQHAEKKMIVALQEAYYLRAMNPSDTAVHMLLAAELGFDLEKYQRELESDELNQAMCAEIEFSRSLPIHGFPSMVLIHQQVSSPIELDYHDHRRSLAQVKRLLSA